MRTVVFGRPECRPARVPGLPGSLGVEGVGSAGSVAKQVSSRCNPAEQYDSGVDAGPPGKIPKPSVPHVPPHWNG